MAERVAITESLLDTLADAISTKSGESTPLTLAEMTDAVNGISAPTGTVNINSNGTHNVLQYAYADVSVPSGAATLQSKSKGYTPTESAQTETVSADVGYDGLSSVDVSVGAISSSYVGSAIDRRDSTDLSTRDDTVEVPAGYYASSASMSVGSGTEGTPTATKGTVTDNKVTVTTSVTNTAGYIAGGTHSGASVNVSASELVSGTYNVTSSGTKDVTNYASASVPSGSATAAATISATGASVSTGTNTLTLSKTVGNTPQVSAGYVSSGTAGNSSVSLTASVTTQAAQTIHPSTTDQSIASGTYLTGAQTIKAVTLANLTADNIKSGVTVKVGDSTDDDCVASVLGTYSGGGGGGASNIVMGKFTTGSTRNAAQSVTIPYTGSGYPIAAMVYIAGGAYNDGTGGNTTWYNSVDRYDVGVWFMSKARTTTAPTYGTSGADNYGITAWIYKNSTSNSTNYARNSTMTANTFTNSSTSASSASTCCRFKGNGKTLSVYVGNKSTSAYGFPPSTELQYIIVYSS